MSRLRSVPSRAWATRRRVPRPLTGLLVAIWLSGTAWALVMPAWDGPDEIQHYSYVETIAEQGRLPGERSRGALDDAGGSPQTGRFIPPEGSSGPFSSALEHAMRRLNGSPVSVGLVRPEQTDLASDQWRREAQDVPQDDGGGVFPGSGYPPAYYALTAVGYSLAGGGATAIDHLYAARLISVLFLLGTAVGVWMLSGELTGHHRPTQVVATAAVGLWPMLSFVSAMVNPDALLFAVWTWALWAMVRIVRHGLTVGRAITLLALVGLALATKTTSLALVPATGYVLLLGLWRARLRLSIPVRRWATPAGLALLVLIPVAAYVALDRVTEQPVFAQAQTAASGGIGNVREFLSYLWQYYLPNLPGQQVIQFDIPGVSSGWPAYNALVTSGWGAFGWVNITFPTGLYAWFLGLTLLIGAAALARLLLVAWRERRSPTLRRVGLPVTVCFGLTFAILLLGLHVTEYKLRSATLQGRYLFPLASLAGLAVALALRWVPAAARPAATGATVGALVGFQLLSLGFVLSRLYA